MAFGVDVEVSDLRVIIRKPDVIVNTSLIPIQPVAEFAYLAATASYLDGFIVSASFATNAATASIALTALTASYVSGAISTWDDITGKPFGIVSSSIQIVNYNLFATTGSNTFVGYQLFQNNIEVLNGITGSLFGTSSVSYTSLYSDTASYAFTSSINVSDIAPTNPKENQLWYDSTTGKTYIYYVSGSVNSWVLQSDPTAEIPPTLLDLQDVTDLGNTTTNSIRIQNNTESTSKSTGALVVDGGIGAENIYAEKIVATEFTGSLSGIASEALLVDYSNISNKPSLVSSSIQTLSHINNQTITPQIVSASSVSASVYVGQQSSIIYVMDGGGLTIQTGVKGDLYIPFNCVITEWILLANQTGSAVIDIWSDTYGNYPPTVADTITGTELPTLSSATKNKSTTLSGWNKNITAGSTLRFNLDSVSSLARITLTLNVIKQ
jgi:hypothetical protein